ncbi:MAG TPA: response regulator [Coleofasciculaceae cyanobacterium]|jgi:chemosensory pili system protein ChpA (sensor histidine kinase/response regulator)
MLSEQQQRIMGYFIEEAKDHLNTLEQGLLNLQSTIADPEMVSEVFRAAHSVKGGAAMLGLSSIQHTAHRLEDYFKILKECPVKVDQRLESLFLRVFDTLQELVDQLQGPFGLTEDRAQEAMAEVEPVFAELGQHLSLLVNQSGSTLPEDLELPIAVPVKAAPVQQKPIAREESALQLIFQSDVPAQLREMLQWFKQADTADSRQHLQRICRSLSQPGEQLDLPNWCVLLRKAEQAIGNSDNTYRTLAPVIIKEIKQAQEQVLAGHHADIAAGQTLLELMPPEEELQQDITDTAFEDLLAAVDTAESVGELPVLESSPLFDAEGFDAEDFGSEGFEDFEGFEASDFEPSTLSTSDSAETDNSTVDFTNSWFDNELTQQEASPGDLSQQEMASDAMFDSFDLSLEAIPEASAETNLLEEEDHTGPEMGAAELNSLADLFEGEVPELGFSWEEETIDNVTDRFSEPSTVDTSSDLSDFLFEQDPDGTEELVLEGFEEEDLSGLLNNSAASLRFSESPRTESSHASNEADSLFDAIGESSEELQFNLDSPQTEDFEDALFGSATAQAFGTESELNPPASSPRSAEAFENLDDLLSGLEIETPTTGSPDNGTISELGELDAIFGEALTESDSLFEDELSFEDELGFGDVLGLENSSEAALSLPQQSSVELGSSLEAVDLPWELPDLSADVWEDSATHTLTDLNFPEQPTEAGSASEDSEMDLDSFFMSEAATAEAIAPPEENGAELFDLSAAGLSEFEGGWASEPDLTSSEPSFENSLGLEDLDNLSLDSSELDSLDTIFGSGSEPLSEHPAEPSTDEGDQESLPFDFSFGDSEPEQSAFNSPAPESAFESEEASFLLVEQSELPEGGFDADLAGEVELSEPIFAGLEDDFDWTGSSDVETSDAEAIDALDPVLEPSNASDSVAQQDDFDPFSLIDPEVSIQEDFQGIRPSEDEIAELEDGLTETIAPEEDDEFGDLEAMLGENFPEEGIASTYDSADDLAESDLSDSNLDDFADLEAMLGDSASDAAMGAVTGGMAVNATEDDFADLEAMLGGDQADVSAAIALPQTEPSQAEDEFGDLEELLEDVKQKLGGSSSQRGARQTSTPANRRTNRRNVLNDQTMRVSVKHLDNLNNLVGEMVVNRNSLEQAQERLRQFLDNLLYQVQQLSDVGQRMRDLYERSLLESSLLSNRRSYHLSPQSSFAPAQSNHATGASFDALEMDRFTGFHTLSQEMIELIVRVRESASDIDFVVEESDQVTRNFRQITTQLQEGLTRSRMVPFAQTADRLPRGVRDNSLKYGKQSELHIEGRDTLIDKMIVEQLYDPMTHLVNNAVAHGIETPAVRVAAGKPPTGKITIRAFHQGNQTIISVSDDGGGIDPDYVKSKAVARGLITAAEAKEMTRLDMYDLLFHHGFSTADQVDDLRGRGVGLDVVRSNLNEIRGVISIDSVIGKGTTFTIRLPLTLSISKALCCISNRARVAFPMDGVEDMLDVPKERIQTDEEGKTSIYWRDALLPFQPLSTLLGYNRILGRGSVYGGNQEDDIVSIVVLRSAGNYLALQVDQVLGEQEIVIKQLEGPIPKPVGVAGATVLGDGRIMPIADVLELIDLSEGRIRREAGSSLWDKSDELPPEPADLKTEPTVLIVDDSITVRELLSMTFNKVGYRVEQARDGQEAWEKLRSGLPCDLVFCDIEMPRMDGLELLSRIQKDPTLAHLPIAMLTSRGADRHRQMAVQLGAKGYFTKPYLEEGLLDAAQRMLKGEVLVNTNV